MKQFITKFLDALSVYVMYAVPLFVTIAAYGYIWNNWNLAGIIIAVASIYTISALINLVR